MEDVVRVIEGWKGIYKEEGGMLRGDDGDGEGYVQIFEVSLTFPPLISPFRPALDLRVTEKLANPRVESGSYDGC